MVYSSQHNVSIHRKEVREICTDRDTAAYSGQYVLNDKLTYFCK